MTITQSEPFTKDQVNQLKEQFEVYIKTVIDIKKQICSAGMGRHFEGEQILLDRGSKQSEKIKAMYKKQIEYFFQPIL